MIRKSLPSYLKKLVLSVKVYKSVLVTGTQSWIIPWTLQVKININCTCQKALIPFLKETGLSDVWRNLYASEKDFTHFSAKHQVHSRIDFFLMSIVDRHRVKECSIGTLDVIHLNDRHKNTMWRMNIKILNNTTTVTEIKGEIRDCVKNNINSGVDPTILWDKAKAILRGNLISRMASMNRAKRL